MYDLKSLSEWHGTDNSDRQDQSFQAEHRKPYTAGTGSRNVQPITRLSDKTDGIADKERRVPDCGSTIFVGKDDKAIMPKSQFWMKANQAPVAPSAPV
jgi:hypothetical protein